MLTETPLRDSIGPSDPPHCDYFAAGRCRSCTFIETPYASQLRDKQDRCSALLAPFVPTRAWLPPLEGGARDFRNKAKLVVGGIAGSVTLGILDRTDAGVDLRDCLIHEPAIRAAIPRIAAFLDAVGIAPYDVPNRRGEAKLVHVQAAPSGALMLRFVVRTQHGFEQIRKHANRLREAVPEATVISVNLLPEHKAALEGEREEPLFGDALRMNLEVPLYLLPQSFFQTNTAVARALYAQAAQWVSEVAPASLWDLYCGVGGFALHTAAPGRETLGVEISEAAIDSARRSAREAGIDARFVAGDATAFALAAAPHEQPELAIVNPPRRGIGPELAAWLDGSTIPNLVYSSCNPQSLARDLAAMPAFEVRQARLFDMFPHTSHLEVAVLLQRAVGG